MTNTRDLLLHTPERSVVRWRAPAYGVLALAAFASIVGIWLLMVLDDDRSPARATADLVLTFTHLTTMLVGVVAVMIAMASTWRWLNLGHLTVTAMAVVTSLVNMLLLDASIEHDWWGVVDLFEHYLIPITLVGLWLVIGPRFVMSWPSMTAVVTVPVAWLAVALVRGSLTDEYPYDFLDVGTKGWASVSLMIGVILAFMLGLGAAMVAIDRRRAPSTLADAG